MANQPHFVLAPDSFKSSLTATQVAQAMEAGIKKVIKDATITKIPMADGGEGTLQAVLASTKGTKISAQVQGPLPNQTVQAHIGIFTDQNQKKAIIEMAQASGLELVPQDQLDPMSTTTYGTGQLIKLALDYNVDEIIIGLGGSATNDGGAGMAQALGAKLRDKENKDLKPGGCNLDQLENIDITKIDPRLTQVPIRIATDVTNPLCGEEGASAIFGPQKGATKEMVAKLDANLAHYANIVHHDLNKDIKDIPGSGAAGGLGGGLLAFTKAKIQPGVELIAELVHLEDAIKEADYVFTGEGKIDNQTQYGKTPFGVAQIAKNHKKPVYCLAGTLDSDIDTLYDSGMTAIFSITQGPATRDQALNPSIAANNIQITSENIARILMSIHPQS